LYAAPDIRGKTYADVDAQVRDPEAQHTGGTFGLSDQDVADIAAFLGSLAPTSKILNLARPDEG
jgi:hypothetical protein